MVQQLSLNFLSFATDFESAKMLTRIAVTAGVAAHVAPIMELGRALLAWFR